MNFKKNSKLNIHEEPSIINSIDVLREDIVIDGLDAKLFHHNIESPDPGDLKRRQETLDRALKLSEKFDLDIDL